MGDVGATTLFCCFCVAPWFSLFLIALSVMILAYDPHPEEDQNGGIIASALFWSRMSFLLLSVGCSIRIYLRMIVPADEPTAVCCDFAKIPAAIAGSRKGFLKDLSSKDSWDNAPGLEFVAVGAKLCDWIYDPEPLTTMIINDLPFDVHILLTVDGVTDTCAYLFAGGKRKFDSIALIRNGEGHARSITMRISRVGFKGRCILTTNDFSPYYSYHLISDEIDRNSQFRLVPRTALPEDIRKVHIEYSHKNNRRGDENEADVTEGVVQWALVAPKASSQKEEDEYKQDNDISAIDIAIDIESPGPKESEGGEDNMLFLVFRGTSNIADVSVNFGGTPLFVSELGLRVHGGMWCALHSHKTSILDHVLSMMKSQGRGKLVIFGHSLGGGYAMLIALELMAKGIQPSAIVTFGCPMVIVPDPESPLWISLQNISLLVVNSWDIVPRMPSFEGWLFRVLPHPQVMGILASSTVLIKQHIRPVWSTIAVYDACGYLIFLDITNPGHAMCVRTDGDVKGGKHREILGATPDIPGSFVIAQHRMGRYIEVCDHLAQSINDKCSMEMQG